MIAGNWLNATITIATNNTTSAAVDLGKEYETVLVTVPTIDSSTLACHVCETLGGTYVALNDTTNTATTGGFQDVWNIGGHRYIKIVTSGAQGSNRTFRVCGIRS